MTITFQYTPPPIEETLQFESVYEDELQLGAEDKAQALKNGIYLWMRVDGALAGEIYAMTCGDDEESLPDIDKYPCAVYLSSMTVLPRYAGKGLGRVLLSHFIGMMSMKPQWSDLVWHATSESMDKLSDFFGADKGAVHQDWYDSGRTATFRRLAL